MDPYPEAGHGAARPAFICKLTAIFGQQARSKARPHPKVHPATLCASRVPQSLQTPIRPGPARDTGKPWMVAAQPPRAAQGSGNQGQLKLVLLAVAAAEIGFHITQQSVHQFLLLTKFRTAEAEAQRQPELSVCAMAVLQHRRAWAFGGLEAAWVGGQRGSWGRSLAAVGPQERAAVSAEDAGFQEGRGGGGGPSLPGREAKARPRPGLRLQEDHAPAPPRPRGPGTSELPATPGPTSGQTAYTPQRLALREYRWSQRKAPVAELGPEAAPAQQQSPGLVNRLHPQPHGPGTSQGVDLVGHKDSSSVWATFPRKSFLNSVLVEMPAPLAVTPPRVTGVVRTGRTRGLASAEVSWCQDLHR
ncbi:hypothetical protein QTO34_016821 [Cnephaeus nilssonii]|uniref:Uncharacterized protein n=1 Tax=Cnephaeus nilssonii TaxID=3371016 RepID=A0AA40I2Y9_CNENI|nr:hypothetical protein QTO34_016821 [Eptesicus nilssonii]